MGGILISLSSRGIQLQRRIQLEAFFASSGLALFQRAFIVFFVLTGILLTIVALVKLWRFISWRRSRSTQGSTRRRSFVEVGERGLVVDRRALNDKKLGFNPDQMCLLGKTYEFDTINVLQKQAPEEGKNGRKGEDLEAGHEVTQKPGREEEPVCYLRECIVCLVEYEKGDLLRKLHACSHVFHQDCIDAWLSTSKTCPFCRTPLSLDTQNLKGINESSQTGPSMDTAPTRGDIC